MDSAWEFIAGSSKNMYVLYQNFNSTNSSCIMATRIKLYNDTREAEYRTRWYNLTAEAPREMKSLYKSQGQILRATQCYPGGGSSTNDYTITYTDNHCAVVLTPHWNRAALNCPAACELWVKEDSVDTWNKLCDQKYEEQCGRRNITVYDKKYCGSIINHFEGKKDEVKTAQ
ncbi:uncharacterized protein LOC142571082 isoform X1 [Dermacentor variabilis]|uniref:uncharacterized protein LOC142571082 isoform X1 n=1 Tax=Dermacentor variabilis TaxID=34621 RepID=UPI003F5B1782